MENIIVHPIDVWQNPNTYLNVEFLGDELFCYFKCLVPELAEKGIHKDEAFLGVFHITGLLEIRHRRYTKLELYPICFDNDYVSYYYEVVNSKWLEQITDYRSSVDNDWLKYDKKQYKHFIFENSKYWIEIIGASIEFKKVKKTKYKMTLWKNI